MNFFAHGRQHIERPYFLAGTAIPDWLNVVNRRARARPKTAQPFVDDEDHRVAEMARGVLRHHEDDRWFHATRAFAEISLGFSQHIRDHFHPSDSLLPMFLGHILVELLLDAELIIAEPERAERYYEAMQTLDPSLITLTVTQMTGKNVDLLAVVIRRFTEERFLIDYLDDYRLLDRLNRIMQRVGLPEIPADFVQWLPEARAVIAGRRDELLDEPAACAAISCIPSDAS